MQNIKTFKKIEGVEEVDADLAANKLHITVNTKKISYEEIKKHLLKIDNVIPEHVDSLLSKLEEMGVAYRIYDDHYDV